MKAQLAEFCILLCLLILQFHYHNNFIHYLSREPENELQRVQVHDIILNILQGSRLLRGHG